MSERIEQFEVEGTPRISLRLPSGSARIVRGEPGVVVVRLRGGTRDVERFVVEQRGDEIVIEPERSTGWGRWSSADVVVEIGEAAVLRARLASGDLAAAVDLAEASVDTAAGDLRLGDVAGPVAVKSASGDVRIGRIGGRAVLTAASGDLIAAEIGGALEVRTASGDLQVGRVEGDVSVRTASGDLRIRGFYGDALDVKTLSGDVHVGVAPGRRYRVSFSSMSGDISTDFPVSEGDAGRAPAAVAVKTVSGDITIVAARD
jgi:hypothetical protein